MTYFAKKFKKLLRNNKKPFQKFKGNSRKSRKIKQRKKYTRDTKKSLEMLGVMIVKDLVALELDVQVI